MVNPTDSIGQKDADASAYQALLQAQLTQEQDAEKLIASLAGLPAPQVDGGQSNPQ